MKSTPYKLGCLLLLLPGYVQTRPTDNHELPRIVMASLAPPSATPLEYSSTKIYTEAFRRMGYELVVVSLPPARASMAAEFGKIDGELTRGPNYGIGHPLLVRVDEPAFTIALSAYSIKPGMRLSGWNRLREQAYRVEYRTGIEISQNAIAIMVPGARLSAVPSTIQGLQKLALGRTDVFIDFEPHVHLLLKQHRFPNSERIFHAGTMQHIPVHAYMSRKDTALAVRLAATLKAMKREGTMAAYLGTAGDDSLESTK